MKKAKYQAPSVEVIELEAEATIMMITSGGGGLSDGDQGGPTMGGSIQYFRKSDGILSGPEE